MIIVLTLTFVTLRKIIQKYFIRINNIFCILNKDIQINYFSRFIPICIIESFKVAKDSNQQKVIKRIKRKKSYKN